MEARILIVDDEAIVRRLLKQFLETAGYAVLTAANGLEALSLVAQERPDLVLLDVEMPGLNGFEVCRRLKADEDTALIPITMLTARQGDDDRLHGIESGADDFLTKPFDPATLRARIRTQLRLKRLTDELEQTEAVIFSMARWVEIKDHYTEGHLRRVAGYGQQVALAMGLSREAQIDVRYAGILHDIGKVGAPEALLARAGPLTPDEHKLLQLHPVHGASIIAAMRCATRVGPIIRGHHERWDGDGYPDCLSGEQIPLGARIIAVVDGWDAMNSDRPYRRALGDVESMRRLQEGSGSQWDPAVVNQFANLLARGALTPIEVPGIEADRLAA